MVLHSLDGETNEEAFARVFALIDGAQESLFVECPYVNGPFLDRLAAARRRGVSVTVVTPENNNFGLCRDAMIWHAGNSGFDVRFYPDRMTHMKALLVDGQRPGRGIGELRRAELPVPAGVHGHRDRSRTGRGLQDPRGRGGPAEVGAVRGDAGALAGRVLEMKLAALETLSALWKGASDSHSAGPETDTSAAAADLVLPGSILKRRRPWGSACRPSS